MSSRRSLVPDLGAIPDLLRTIPQIASDLSAMRKAVVSMDRQMKEMRRGVDEVSAKVVELRAGVEGKLGEVEEHVAGMESDVHKMRIGVERLEPKLDEMQRTLKPMRRTAERLGLRRKGELVLEEEPIDPETEETETPYSPG